MQETRKEAQLLASFKHLGCAGNCESSPRGLMSLVLPGNRLDALLRTSKHLAYKVTTKGDNFSQEFRRKVHYAFLARQFQSSLSQVGELGPSGKKGNNQCFGNPENCQAGHLRHPFIVDYRSNLMDSGVMHRPREATRSIQLSSGLIM